MRAIDFFSFLLRDIRRTLNYNTGLPRRLPPPTYLYLEPTNKCNLNCFMCPRSEMKREIGDITFDNFRKIIDKLAGYRIRFVQLNLFGEPLLHPQIFDFVDYCKDKGFEEVGFSTNCTIMTELIADRILNSRLDYIILALDATDEEIYKKIRIGGKFEATLKNVRYFINKRGTSKKPMLIIQLIRMRDNEKEIIKFMKEWTPYADEISFPPLVVWADQMKGLETHALPKKRGYGRYPCSFIWDKLCVCWNGDILLCCTDFDAGFNIGNMLKDDLDSIWNGEFFTKIRRMHREGRFLKLCKYCDSWDGTPPFTFLHLIKIIKREICSRFNKNL